MLIYFIFYSFLKEKIVQNYMQNRETLSEAIQL